MRLLLDSLTAKEIEIQALTTRKISNNEQLISVSSRIEIPKKMLTVGNGLIDYLLSRRIRQKLDKIKPDVIHVQDTYILPATVRANYQKIPIVVTIRNSVLDETLELMFSFPASTLLKRRNRTIIKALGGVDAVISVSRYIKTELVQRGIDAFKVHPIYNLPPPLKSAKESPPSVCDDTKINILAPGFLASFKGFSTLVKAMAVVVKNNTNVCLTILGKGPEKTKLEKLTKTLKLEPYVKFVGKIPFDNMSSQYCQSDIVVFPSIYPEPFGRVALEAMYFGKPVVASRVGGISEVVENRKTGLLVPPDNHEKLAKAILALTESMQLRMKLGEVGKAIVEQKFNPEQIITSHLTVYCNIMYAKRDPANLSTIKPNYPSSVSTKVTVTRDVR